MRPQILVPDNAGMHNTTEYVERLERENLYRDLSTVIVCPTRVGMIPARIVQSWQCLVRPMNQKVFGPFFIEGMEVAAAYNAAIDMILKEPTLSQCKFVLTLEEDNAPPPDGLIRLYESIDDYDAVGGLYWTKGPGGQPMCYGDPDQMPLNFLPQIPKPDQVTPCNGLGMGFTLFRTEMFRDERFKQGEWFRTLNGAEGSYTQDLYFFEQARKIGYRSGCDARVRVGHYDAAEQMMW